MKTINHIQGLFLSLRISIPAVDTFDKWLFFTDESIPCPFMSNIKPITLTKVPDFIKGNYNFAVIPSPEYIKTGEIWYLIDTFIRDYPSDFII